jgi:hypothetical protein
LWSFVAAVIVLSGCGSSSKFDGTAMHLFISSALPASTTNSFSVELVGETVGCPLSASATLAINGTTYPFGSCTGASDPFEGNPSFALQAADGDDQAEMDVAGLVPGLGATIVSPVGGQVAPGGTVTVSIPSAFQGQLPVYAEFNNTSNVDTYGGSFDYSPTSTDGQTAVISVPQHPATYEFSVAMGMGTPPVTQGIISGDLLSCTGFAHCYVEAIDQLGPMLVTVTP